MNLPPRFFTVLALMQLGFVAGGFLITRAALRFYYHVDKTLLLPIPFPARLVNELAC